MKQARDRRAIDGTKGLASTCVLSNGERCFEVTKSAGAIKYENTIKQTMSARAPSYIVKLPLLHLRISGRDIKIDHNNN